MMEKKKKVMVMKKRKKKSKRSSKDYYYKMAKHKSLIIKYASPNKASRTYYIKINYSVRDQTAKKLRIPVAVMVNAKLIGRINKMEVTKHSC